MSNSGGRQCGGGRRRQWGGLGFVLRCSFLGSDEVSFGSGSGSGSGANREGVEVEGGGGGDPAAGEDGGGGMECRWVGNSGSSRRRRRRGRGGSGGGKRPFGFDWLVRLRGVGALMLPFIPN